MIARRDNSRWGQRPRGTWKPLLLGDGAVSATVVCPGCGEPLSLDDHEIGAGGAVTPSVQCPICTHYDTGLVLDGWPPTEYLQ